MILSHPEFTSYQSRVVAIFDNWRASTEPLLRGFTQACQPKALLISNKPPQT
jgi:hypothetical protein